MTWCCCSPRRQEDQIVRRLEEDQEDRGLADGDNSASFVRNIFGFTESPDTASKVQMAPPGSTLDKLFASGFGAVIAVAHTSKMMQDKSYEQFAKKGGFTLNAIDPPRRWPARSPASARRRCRPARFRRRRQIPDDELDTIGLQWLLVAQSKMATIDRGRSRRVIYENKASSRSTTALPPRSNPRDRQGRLHHRASGRGRIHQRRHQVVHG